MKGKTCRDAGGRTPKKSKEDWAGGNPWVHGEDEKKTGDEKKHGGKVHKKKKEEAMAGAKAKHRLDRPGRKHGGRAGAERSPLSSAHKGSSGHEAD